jgi:hypothetical protein
MPYEPEWQRLSHALKRVVAAAIDEVSAKRAICDAIADGKIAVRLYFLVPPISIDWRPRRELSVTYARELRKGEIPPRLTPRDFDWVQSRIRKSGRWEKVRGPFGSFVGQWEVIDAARHTPDKRPPESHRRPPSGDRVMAYWHRVELRRADVTELLKIRLAEQHAGDVLERRLAQLLPKLGPKTLAIAEIIIELGPKHILQLPSKKERNKEIIERLPKKGHKIPEYPERSIQRLLALLRQ